MQALRKQAPWYVLRTFIRRLVFDTVILRREGGLEPAVINAVLTPSCSPHTFDFRPLALSLVPDAPLHAQTSSHGSDDNEGHSMEGAVFSTQLYDPS